MCVGLPSCSIGGWRTIVKPHTRQAECIQQQIPASSETVFKLRGHLRISSEAIEGRTSCTCASRSNVLVVHGLGIACYTGASNRRRWTSGILGQRPHSTWIHRKVRSWTTGLEQNKQVRQCLELCFSIGPKERQNPRRRNFPPQSPRVLSQAGGETPGPRAEVGGLDAAPGGHGGGRSLAGGWMGGMSLFCFFSSSSFRLGFKGKPRGQP